VDYEEGTSSGVKEILVEGKRRKTTGHVSPQVCRVMRSREEVQGWGVALDREGVLKKIERTRKQI